MWQGGDPGPGGGDGLCPGPGGGDSQPPLATAADQLGGGVQDPVTSGLWFCSGQVVVQGDEPQPGQQDRGDQGDGQPRGVHREIMRGNRPIPQSFPVRSSRRCRSSRSASWPLLVPVAKAVNRWPSMSVNRSCAPAAIPIRYCVGRCAHNVTVAHSGPGHWILRRCDYGWIVWISDQTSRGRRPPRFVNLVRGRRRVVRCGGYVTG